MATVQDAKSTVSRPVASQIAAGADGTKVGSAIVHGRRAWGAQSISMPLIAIGSITNP